MNHYKLEAPLCISFSGGRSSAYMLYKIIEAHGGTLPDEVEITFANTGKEMPQTLDFVNECSKQWNVPVIWLELEITVDEEKKKYGTKVVTYETASREGEPFTNLIKARKYLPNPIARFCTAELKVKRINAYLKSFGWKDWDSAIGIRADESRRVHKMMNSDSFKGETRVFPMYHAGVTKETIYDFWINQEFDLQLPNNNGTTDWGNCDLCYLKGAKKKISIIRERPDLAQWWINSEKLIASTFRNDHPSYERMLDITDEQYGFDFDDSISCFCGD